MRHALTEIVPVHVVDEPADIFAGEIAFQRPGRVGVAEGRRHVRHVGIHHALVGQRVGEIDGAAVDADFETADDLEHQPRRGDDDVGRKLAAVLQANAVARKGVDLVGDDGGTLLADRLEQIAVGHEAEPLVPGIVARREMGRDVVVGAERHLHALEHQLLDLGRPAPAELEEEHPPHHVAPADDMIGKPRRQIAAQFVGDGVLRRTRHHIGRRALEHGDLRRLLGELRHQRHCGCARADHDDAFSRVVDVLGPFLRMHDAAGEIRHARELRRIARLVFVIARAHEQEIAGEAHELGCALARDALGLDGPARVRRRPRRALDAMTEADVLLDAVLGCCLAHVVQDLRPIGDRLRIGPRLEGIAEREHVAVGADAGIAEQVPGAADTVAAFEDDVALARALALKMIARANAGQAGTDDEHVEMFCGFSHGVLPGTGWATPCRIATVRRWQRRRQGPCRNTRRIPLPCHP